MATLDSLPGDQRAVLQLVLQRGRTYDEIAALLSIDRAAVRQRALAAFDALGPQTGLEAQRRALIADYLLGQLPARVSEETREQLAESPSERAWARVVASELTSVAANPLPEIPVESTRRDALPDAEPARRRRPFPKPAREPAAATSGASELTATPDEPPDDGGARQPRVSAGRPSSRRGGALVLGAALIVIVVAIVVIATGGSSNNTSTSTSARVPSTTAASTTGTTATTTPQVVRQINLVSPGAPTTKTAGLADVLKQGGTDGIAIIAQNVPPNTKHNAYAVWLYNSPTDSHILGFVNPGVGANGRLSTAGPLPANASRYKQLIVTLETQGNPKAPGQIILEGALALA